MWRLEPREGVEDHEVTGTSVRRCGQMRERKIIEPFLANLLPNTTGLYSTAFPFLYKRAHEQYFCRKSWDQNIENPSVLPVVFNDMLERKMLRHLCPGTGDHIRTLDVEFDPSSILIDSSGLLFHPLTSSRRRNKRLVHFGLLSSNLSQSIATEWGEMESSEDGSGNLAMKLHWNGTVYDLKTLD